MKKKTFSILLSFILIFQALGLSVSAADKQEFVKDDLKIGLLTALDIVNPDKLPGVDREMTRGEFAYYADKLMNPTSDNIDTDIFFWDIADDYQYKDAVYRLASYGYINGYDDGSFGPNNTITKGAAVKILVCMLGYADYSEIIGSYSYGYMTIAKDLNLIPARFSDSSEALDTNTFISLMYNALNASVAEIKSVKVNMTGGFDVEYSNMNYSSENNVTMLEKYWDIKYIEGVVEANSYTSIYWNDTKANNALRIGGKDYPSDKKFDKYLGYRVACFYKVGSKEEPMGVCYAYPVDETTAWTVSPEDDIELSGNTLSYYEGTSKKKLSLDKEELCVLYNGRPINYRTEFNSSLFDFADGNVLLIDNNDDNKIDVIRVTEYESMVALKTDVESNKIYNKKTGELPVEIDENAYWIVTDTLGNEMTIGDIAADSVLSIATSNDETVYEIIVSYDYVEGSVSAIKTDGYYKVVTIDSKQYKAITTEVGDKLINGKEYVFYLNASGYIVAVEEGKSDAMAYGYLTNIINDNVIEETFAQVITKNNEKINIYFGNATKIDGTNVKRAEVEAYFNTNFPVASGETYIKEIIRYSLKEDGTFKEIDTAVYNSGKESEDTLRARYEGNKMAYKTGAGSFSRMYIPSGDMGSAGFLGISSFVYSLNPNDMLMVAEPAKAEGASDIDLTDVKVFTRNNLENDQKNIDIKLYSINNDTPMLTAAIARNGSAVRTGIGVPIYVVTEKEKGVAPDDEVRDYVTLSNGTTSITLFKSEEYENPGGSYVSFEDMNIGDIVRYGTDFNGYIQKCLRLYDYNNRSITTYHGYMETEYRVTGGVVYDAKDNYVRIFSKYKDRAGNTIEVTPQNVSLAIEEQWYLLQNNWSSIMTKRPEMTDAIDLLSETVYVSSVNSYEVVRDNVVFSKATTSDISSYLNSGSECSTLILISKYGNMPAETMLLVK